MERLIFIALQIILIYVFWSYMMTLHYTRTEETGLALAMTLTIVLVQDSAVAMLLAISGCYSLVIFNFFLLIELTILIWYHYKVHYIVAFDKLVGRLKTYRFSRIAAGLLIIGSILYLSFPTKYMLGGRDPGLYLLNGIHIAKTGSIQYETDSYLNENYEELKTIVSPGYPALFSPLEYEQMSGEPGDISVQFMPMFPAILAVGYSLGGLECLVRVNAIISLLSILILYYLSKLHFHKNAAIILLAFMILNPAQLWGARLTETEIMSQLMFFCSMFLILEAWNKDRYMPYLYAGALLGLGCMNRIDTYIYGLGLFVMLAYCVYWLPEKRKQISLVCAGYSFFALLSFVYGMFYSQAYFIMQWKNHSLVIAILINIIGLCLVCISQIFSFMIPVQKRKNIWMQMIKKPSVLRFVMALLTGAFLFLYLVRPRIEAGFSGRSLIEFCWYTSVVMFACMLWGLYHLLQIQAEQSQKYFVLFLISISSLMAYLLRPSISSDHIWAARRWITVNIPFVLLMGTYGLYFLSSREKGIQKKIGYCLVAILCLFYTWRCYPFLLKSMLRDIDQQYEQLAEKLDDNEIYFTDNEGYASYLRFAYGKQIYLINKDKPERLSGYIKDHGSIWYIGNTRSLADERLSLDIQPLWNAKLGGEFLEESIGAFPKKLYDRKMDANINHISYNTTGVIQLGASDMQLSASVWENDKIISTKEGGLVFYGPYISLPAGRYILSFMVEYDEKMGEQIYGDIVADAANANLIVLTDIAQGKNQIIFDVPSQTDLVEFRMFAGENSGLKCWGIRLEKVF